MMLIESADLTMQFSFIENNPSSNPLTEYCRLTIWLQ